MLCEYWIAEIPSLRNVVRYYENKRKTLSLNYKSAALNQLSYAGERRTKVKTKQAEMVCSFHQSFPG